MIVGALKLLPEDNSRKVIFIFCLSCWFNSLSLAGRLVESRVAASQTPGEDEKVLLCRARFVFMFLIDGDRTRHESLCCHSTHRQTETGFYFFVSTLLLS